MTINNDQFQPKPEDKFSFGLWTVGNRGRDPFGDFVRPVISPVDSASRSCRHRVVDWPATIKFTITG